MKTTTILYICFGIILVTLGIGTYLIFESSEDYVLWCVDRNGMEIPIKFTGINKEDINAVQVCRRNMFEPVDYYIVPIIT